MSSGDIFQRISLWVGEHFKNDPDVSLVLGASKGDPVDGEELAAAYWRAYYATYRPREEWLSLARGRRNSIYRTRLKLISAYAGFSADQRESVFRLRPPPPRR